VKLSARRSRTARIRRLFGRGGRQFLDGPLRGGFPGGRSGDHRVYGGRGVGV